jgi:SAM-dependent methyltransferase/uncharacterized protein YbaR (Trm112 family)
MASTYPARPMKDRLVSLLRCPHDARAIHVADESSRSDGELHEGELACADGHRFPVRAGVPRMTPDATAGQGGTFESFTAKWSSVDRDELRQRFDQQYRWYDERHGFEGDDGLRRFLDGRSLILEAGTGLGGDAARFARLSDADVVALDLSDSVEMAHREFGGIENVHYVQADLMHPPVEPGRFDFVSAEQVLHHTPDTRRAFSSVRSLLAPGGQIAVYVYKEKALLRELADERIRELTTRMSVDECMQFSAQVTELGRELSRLGATVKLEQGVPLLGIEPGEHDVQRLIYWTFLKCFWNDDFSDNLNVLVNFDWYHPPYAWRHTPEEVRGWCEEDGLAVERLDVMESGISVLATQPE